VENGHTIPTLETLEKLAKAFDLELYQLFYAGDGKPVAPGVREVSPLNSPEESLLKRFRALRGADQQLILGLAGRLVRRRRNHSVQT
jgi:transcriptional regulator with XRE-family HTH domain